VEGEDLNKKLRGLLILANVIVIALVLWMLYAIVSHWMGASDGDGARQAADQTTPEASQNAPNENAVPRNQYDLITRHDIFDTSPVQQPSRTNRTNEPQKTSGFIRLKLRGTVIGPGDEAYAIIYNETKRHEDFYYLNDFIGPYQIRQIAADHVVLESKQGRRTLELEVKDLPQGPAAGPRPRKG
jgi:type II secretory pathway component PulC